MSHGLSVTHPRDTTVLLGYCPTLLFVMTFLLAALQPEFNIKEVCVCRVYSTHGYVVFLILTAASVCKPGAVWRKCRNPAR